MFNYPSKRHAKQESDELPLILLAQMAGSYGSIAFTPLLPLPEGRKRLLMEVLYGGITNELSKVWRLS